MMAVVMTNIENKPAAKAPVKAVAKPAAVAQAPAASSGMKSE
jgi:hypothetical protein